MTTQLDVAVEAIVAALVASGVVPPNRVHSEPPGQVVAPCVWIDPPTVASEVAGSFSSIVLATFPIRAVVDGGDRPQRLTQRELTARLWDALNSVTKGRVDEIRPETVDIGGTSTRSVLATFTYSITAQALCGASLVEVTA